MYSKKCFVNSELAPMTNYHYLTGILISVCQFVEIRLQKHTCEPSGGGIFLPILRVPSVSPVNFQNLPPVKKIKYKKILTYILRSIFLEIPHLELLR